MRPEDAESYSVYYDARTRTHHITNSKNETVIITDEIARTDPVFARLQRSMLMYPAQRSAVSEDIITAWFDKRKGRAVEACTNHFICTDCHRCHSCQPQDANWTGVDVCPVCELDREICTCEVAAGHPPAPEITPEQRAEIQQAEEEFDRLITQASTPSLAELVKRGIKTGAIEAKANYTN